MKRTHLWILFPVAISLILALGFISGSWIGATIMPGAIAMDLLIRLPRSPIVAFTQATNANPASVLVLGSIAISAAIWSGLGIGVVGVISLMRAKREMRNA